VEVPQVETIIADATTLVADRDQLGEGPAYDAAGDRLLWVDIVGPEVHELLAGPGGWRPGRTWELVEPVGAVVPRAAGGLLVAVGTRFCALEEDGSLTTIAHLDTGGASARFNDCKCDPRGRLVAGWMVTDLSTPGELVRLDPDGSVSVLLEGVRLSNGLDWSPDGTTFYFIDTPAMGVDAFDYDLDAGSLSRRRRIVTFPAGANPDGMCVDDEGCLWVAAIFAGEVRRFSPDGEPLGVVRTPAPQVTSCAFGGPDGGELLMTSLSVEVPRELTEGWGIPGERIAAAAASTTSGGLFTCRPGVTGPAATPFG
jgi:sugar lactone lactonase YvrE